MDKDQYSEIFEAFSGEGHHMGGYAFFSQLDPRERQYGNHTTLLLQIDSDKTDADEGIIWGSYGSAGFFITPECLRKRDFSDVLYDWACG